MGAQTKFRTIRKDGTLNIRPPRGISIFDLYHDLLKINWLLFAFLSSSLFFLINVFYGAIYCWLPRSEFDGFKYEEGLMRFAESFFFSVQTFGTIGYGKVSPSGIASNIVMTCECYTSLFMVALMTGIIFARFARPVAKILFSEKAVIRDFDGVPCLMFRIANSRQNFITEARVRLTLVIDNPKSKFREFTELKLEREISPIFALSWTIAHDIDSTSPLYGLEYGELCARNAELIVAFNGIDTTLSTNVYDKHSYIIEEVIRDHDFVDVIHRNKDGTMELKLGQFHKIEPIEV